MLKLMFCGLVKHWSSRPPYGLEQTKNLAPIPALDLPAHGQPGQGYPTYGTLTARVGETMS